MTVISILGYAPRQHNLAGFYDTTACEIQIDTAYAGDRYPMAVPPIAMPVHEYRFKCGYCGVTQEMPKGVWQCACCGAPL